MLIKQTSGGLLLDLGTLAPDMHCPFHPPELKTYGKDELQLRAQRIALRSGLDHLSLNLKINGPTPVKLKFEARKLILGFASSGWAKIRFSNRNIEKLEQGQWLQLTEEQLLFDRTSTKGLDIQLFLCSEFFISTLNALGSENCGERHFKFSDQQAGSGFQYGSMPSDALSIAAAIAESLANTIRHRLQLESNALAWIALALRFPEDASETTQIRLSAQDRAAIEAVTEAMKKDPGLEFSLSELCQVGKTNEHKLKSAFKEIHGKTVFTYLRELRMDYAAQLLRGDQYSVIEVANEVGYTNASHFARAFKERHSLLPKAYQCVHRRQFVS